MLDLEGSDTNSFGLRSSNSDQNFHSSLSGTFRIVVPRSLACKSKWELHCEPDTRHRSYSGCRRCSMEPRIGLPSILENIRTSMEDDLGYRYEIIGPDNSALCFCNNQNIDIDRRAHHRSQAYTNISGSRFRGSCKCRHYDIPNRIEQKPNL